MDYAAKYQWIRVTKWYILLELHKHDSAIHSETQSSQQGERSTANSNHALTLNPLI